MNVPEYGMCTASEVVGEYDFDEGLETKTGENEEIFRRSGKPYSPHPSR